LTSSAQRKREFARLDRALGPARELVVQAVDAMVAVAKRAEGLPDVPPSVIEQLNEAVAITAATGRLPRSACSKVIQDEFLIRLVLRLEDLEADGVSELMSHTRASLDVALARLQ
jgi:hypothetical protein